MQLHPQMKAILDQAAAAGGKPFHAMTPAEARQGIAALLEPFNSAPEKVARSERRNIPGPGGQIPVQIYTPKGQAPFPILVYFHGGGWTVGDIDVVGFVLPLALQRFGMRDGVGRLPARAGAQISRRAGRLLRRDQMGGGERGRRSAATRRASRSAATARAEISPRWSP